MILINSNINRKIGSFVLATGLVATILIFSTGASYGNSSHDADIEDDGNTTYVEEPTQPIATTSALTENSFTEMPVTQPEVTEVSCIQYYTEQDAIDIAKVLYRECRGVPSKTEQACVAWTILNRVDRYNSTVYSVVRSPNQFAFYENTPVWDELLDLAYDVLGRWSQEKNGLGDVGRVLPAEYTFFEGRDGHNHFRDNYTGSYTVWDYSLESLYED